MMLSFLISSNESTCAAISFQLVSVKFLKFFLRQSTNASLCDIIIWLRKLMGLSSMRRAVHFLEIKQCNKDLSENRGIRCTMVLIMIQKFSCNWYLSTNEMDSDTCHTQLALQFENGSWLVLPSRKIYLATLFQNFLKTNCNQNWS